jgi:hypothetical protein
MNMKILRRLAAVLVLLIPACGQQLVEFADKNAAGAGSGGQSGVGGNGGRGGSAGAAAAGSGVAGEGDGGQSDGGESGDGSGGVGGVGGIGGVAGTVGGLGGESGESGAAGATSFLEVTTTNPNDQDQNVAINKAIVANFDQALDPSTVPASFTLVGPGTTPVSGMVNVLGTVATFRPNTPLAPNTTFTATITTAATALAGDALQSDYEWVFTTGSQAAQTIPQLPVPLGAAASFAILGSSQIVNIPTSRVTGDVGLTPDAGSRITGFSQPATCPEIALGFMVVVDATGPACAVVNPVLLQNAKTAAQAAYLDATAAIRGTPQVISGNINGLTLYPGLYESGSTIEISPAGFLYLDAQGDSNAVFIIRSATSITTQATSAVVLTKGARAANVYWTAGSTLTLGVDSIMKGTVIAGTAMTLQSRANLEGRALNQGAAAAAITIDASVVTLPTP